MANEKHFTGDEGKFVPKIDASKWLQNFQKKNPDHIKGLFFGEKLIKELLNQPKAVGVRIYYAEKDNGTPAMVLVATDKDMQDIPTRSTPIKGSGDTSASRGDDDDSGYGDDGSPCPTFC